MKFKFVCLILVPLLSAHTAMAQTPSTAPANAAPATRPGVVAAPGTGRQGGGRAGGTRGPAVSAPIVEIERPAEGPPMISDDFESGDYKKDVWTQIRVQGAATIKVQSDKVAHGKYALQAHYPAGSSSRSTWAMLGTMLPVSLHDRMFGRAYIYISGINTMQHNVLMLAGSSGFPTANFLEIGTYAGIFQPSYQLNDPSAMGRGRSEVGKRQGEIPLNKWVCLEWQFTDKPETRIVMWIDGKLIVNQTYVSGGFSSDLTKGFVEFDLGFRTWDGSQTLTADIYYDDVAIGDKPIAPLSPVPAAATP